MYGVFAIVFWFSLLFGTFVTGNSLGNWIALIALLMLIRTRRRQIAQQSTRIGAVDNKAVPQPAPGRAHAIVTPERAQPPSTVRQAVRAVLRRRVAAGGSYVRLLTRRLRLHSLPELPLGRSDLKEVP